MSDISINSNFDEAHRELYAAMERALEKCGLTAEAYAKLICPVDTGRLRSSITHEVRMSENAVYIGTNVEYAAVVELGIPPKRKGQPYLRPAAENHTEEYKQIIMSELKG